MMMWLTLLRSPSARAEEVHRQEMASNMIGPTLRTVACLMVEASLSSPGCPPKLAARVGFVQECCLSGYTLAEAPRIPWRGEARPKRGGQLQHSSGRIA